MGTQIFIFYFKFSAFFCFLENAIIDVYVYGITSKKETDH